MGVGGKRTEAGGRGVGIHVGGVDGGGVRDGVDGCQCGRALDSGVVSKAPIYAKCA